MMNTIEWKRKKKLIILIYSQPSLKKEKKKELFNKQLKMYKNGEHIINMDKIIIVAKI